MSILNGLPNFFFKLVFSKLTKGGNFLSEVFNFTAIVKTTNETWDNVCVFFVLPWEKPFVFFGILNLMTKDEFYSLFISESMVSLRFGSEANSTVVGTAKKNLRTSSHK